MVCRLQTFKSILLLFGLCGLTACAAEQGRIVRFVGPPGTSMTIGEHVLAEKQQNVVQLPAVVHFKPTPAFVADRAMTPDELGRDNVTGTFANDAPISFEFASMTAIGKISVFQTFSDQTDQIATNSIEITDATIKQLQDGNIVSFWCKSASGQLICTFKLSKVAKMKPGDVY